MIARRHYACDAEKLDTYESGAPDRVEVAGDDPAAVLVSSRLQGGGDRHAPVIDIDHHCWIEPSSTPGHGHLYIDVEMTWAQYEAILRALVEAGVVEPGYLGASIERGATMVRLPHVRKPTLVAGEYT